MKGLISASWASVALYALESAIIAAAAAFTLAAGMPMPNASLRAWYGRRPGNSMVSFRISSGVLAATSSISMRPAAEAGRHYQQGAGERSQSTLPARSRHANRFAAAEARYGYGTSPGCEFRHGGGRTGKRLSGCRATAVASIRLLPCACSVSVIERRICGQTAYGFDTEPFPPRKDRRTTCRGGRGAGRSFLVRQAALRTGCGYRQSKNRRRSSFAESGLR